MMKWLLTSLLIWPLVLRAGGPLATNTFTYASSKTPSITNLVGMVIYDTSATQRMPMVPFMHPYSDNGADPSFNTLPIVWGGGTSNMLTAYASNGWFVCAFGMRGRGALGTNDDSGLELWDVWDGIAYVETNYLHILNHYIFMDGESGGGGNTYNFICKFPGKVNAARVHAGMSDYGYDSTYGWYQVSGPHPSLIRNIGGTPAEVPDAYHARYVLDTIARAVISNSFIFVFQNTNDPTVTNNQSARVADAFLAANNPRIQFNLGTGTRYEHGLPSAAPWTPDGFTNYMPTITNGACPHWTMPSSGSGYPVLGYMKCDEFEIWGGGGTNSVFTLDWNTITGNYTVTPVTATPIVVRIYQSGFSVTQSVTTATTLNMGFTVQPPSNFRVDPADISNVSLGGGAGYVAYQFRWNDNANNETGYEIEVSTNSVDFYREGTRGANAEAYDTANVPWTSNRWYRVRAVSGSSVSPYTPAILAIGNMPPTALAGAVPATNRMSLTWSTAGGILDGYTIQVDTNADFSSPAMQTWFAPGQATASWEITNQFILNRIYYFRVVSHSVGGNSEAMNKPIAYLAVAPNGPPIAPTFRSENMTASANEAVILFDDYALNRSGYTLEFSTNGGSAWIAVTAAYTGVTRNSVTQSSLNGEFNYMYRLAATNTLGSSAYATWTFHPPLASSGFHVYYVDNAATGNATGTNWANAFPDAGGIPWSQLVAGDVVYISGGTSGKSYTNIFVSYGGGSYGNPIVIKTATNSPHNGRVTIYGGMYWRSSYVTVDGSSNAAVTYFNAESVPNNINLTIVGLATADPVMQPVVCVGAVGKWMEITGGGSPISGEGDGDGLLAQPTSIGPTNSEFAYLWIHDNFGHIIRQGRGDGYAASASGITFHHILGEDCHNNFVMGQGWYGMHDCLLRNWKAPGVAHPDALQGGFQDTRIWNNRFMNWAPSGQGFYPDFGGSMTNTFLINNVFACQNQDSQYAPSADNIYIVNQWIIGNTLYGSNTTSFSITSSGKTNLTILTSRFQNNLLYSGTNASAGSAQFSSGGWKYDTADLIFDGNVVCGPSKLILYRTNNAVGYANGVNTFTSAEQFNAWSSSYKSNHSAAVQFLREYQFNFRLHGSDTAAQGHALDLSALSSTFGPITNDLANAVRGPWDVGAFQNNRRFKLHWDFEGYTNGRITMVEDMTGGGHGGHAPTNATRTGVGNGNYSPGVVSGRVGLQAANFQNLGTNEQWYAYSNNFGYTIGNWLGITNLNGLTLLTNGTILFWKCSTNTTGLGDETIWSGGFADTDYSFDVTRYNVDALSIGRWASGTWAAKGSVVDRTNEWHHYAFTWNGTNNWVKTYIDGTLTQSNAMAAPYFTEYPNGGNVIVGASAFGLDYTMLNGHPNNGWFNGWLDELKLADIDLTDAEVQAEFEGIGGGAGNSVTTGVGEGESTLTVTGRAGGSARIGGRATVR